MDEMREAFETAISEPPYEHRTERFDENDYCGWAGHYVDYSVHLAWEMFKAGVKYGKESENGSTNRS